MTKELTPRGARLKKTFSLTPRDRRYFLQQILQAQQAIDDAVEARDKVLALAWGKGLSYAVIGAAVAMHSTTVKDRIDALSRGTEEDPEAGS
jgi:DNA-directed RNA polymerase specialized sigma24 family protein